MPLQRRTTSTEKQLTAADFYKAIAPFTALCNKYALSANYRALYLSPTCIRGASAFGMMEVEFATTLDRELYVDAESFLQVMKSLPPAPITFTPANTSLGWKCGATRGQLAYFGEKVEIPELPWPQEPKTELDESFSTQLELGALACGSTAFMSVGLYGVIIDNSPDGLFAYSTDNMSIAVSRLGTHIPDIASEFVLSPDSVKLLALLTRGKASLFADDKAVLCRTPTTRLVLKQIPALKHDIKSIAGNFQEEEVTVNLNRSVIAAFIKRAEALSSEAAEAHVAIAVEDRATKLSFHEGKASSEEFYLVEDAPDVKIAPIFVEVRRMARVLSRTEKIVFDYAHKSTLVMRGGDNFIFVISGKKEEVKPEA